MENTSPYTARQTPPTASMKSLAAGDENTPPGHDMARELSEKGAWANQLPTPSLTQHNFAKSAVSHAAKGAQHVVLVS
jgi:hypothetical protein